MTDPTRAPKANGDPAEVARKLSLLQEPHVAPLTAFVERLRVQHGGGESVPWFDPTEAGVHARILALLEAPGPKATGATGPRPKARGSGFISADNTDPTADHVWHLLRDSRIDRARGIRSLEHRAVVRRGWARDPQRHARGSRTGAAGVARAARPDARVACRDAARWRRAEGLGASSRQPGRPRHPSSSPESAVAPPLPDGAAGAPRCIRPGQSVIGDGGGLLLGEDVVCHAATVGIPIAARGDSGLPAGNRLCRPGSALVIFGAI